MNRPLPLAGLALAVLAWGATPGRAESGPARPICRSAVDTVVRGSNTGIDLRVTGACVRLGATVSGNRNRIDVVAPASGTRTRLYHGGSNRDLTLIADQDFADTMVFSGGCAREPGRRVHRISRSDGAIQVIPCRR